MNLHFEPHAQRELEDTVAYYDAIRRELGDSFVAEVERLIERILSFPVPAKSCQPQRGVAE